MFAIVEGFILYLLLCGFTVLTGRGIVRLLKLETPSSHSAQAPAGPLLAVVLTMLYWTIIVGVLVGLRLPVRVVAPLLWGSSLCFAVYGWRGVRTWMRGGSMVWIACLIAPVVLMAEHFCNGLTNHLGSIAPDGWSYMSYAEYIWKYPRHTEGGLLPLYQYAAHLNAARFISRALISAFSPLSHGGDTQSVAALYQAWSSFVLACSVGFCLAAHRQRTWVVVAGVLVTVVSGWMGNLVWTYNFDNGLALSYLPAFAGILVLLELRSWRWWFVLGGLVAGILYTYPELAPLVLVGAGMIALPRLWKERTQWWRWARGGVLAVVVAGVLWWPEAGAMIKFWRGQFHSVSQAPSIRTAEGYFPGVKEADFHPGAFWGLGGEHRLATHRQARNALGYVMSVLALLGLVQLTRRGEWGWSLQILLFVAAALYWMVARQYSYATYKMILFNWWGLITAVVLGCEALLGSIAARSWRRVVAGILVGLGTIVLLQSQNAANAGTMSQYLRSRNAGLQAPDFRRVTETRNILKGQPLLMLVDEWYAHEWALYYLRDTPTYLPSYRMLMNQPHVVPFMERAQRPDPLSLNYVLTDAFFDRRSATGMGWEAVWEGGPYRLWKMARPEWAVLTRIENPGGFNPSGEQAFTWLGESPATLHVLSAAPGVLQVGAGFQPGPNLANRESCRLRISAGTESEEEITIGRGYHVFSLPVNEGENRIVLEPLDRPADTGDALLDRKPLLLGLQDVVVQLTPGVASTMDHAAMVSIQNRRGFTRKNGQPFFSMSKEPSVVRIQSSREGVILLTARMSVPAGSPGDEATVRATADTGSTQTVRMVDGVQTLEIPVRVGLTEVQLQVLESAGAEEVGVQRLRIWFKRGGSVS